MAHGDGRDALFCKRHDRSGGAQTPPAEPPDLRLETHGLARVSCFVGSRRTRLRPDRSRGAQLRARAYGLLSLAGAAV
jgi:hypothetical protein